MFMRAVYTQNRGCFLFQGKICTVIFSKLKNTKLCEDVCINVAKDVIQNNHSVTSEIVFKVIGLQWHNYLDKRRQGGLMLAIF
jgi:hypothetical protein